MVTHSEWLVWNVTEPGGSVCGVSVLLTATVILLTVVKFTVAFS